MKKKKKNWDAVPWTPFLQGRLPDDGSPAGKDVHRNLLAVALNSRYQVNIYEVPDVPGFGDMVWLSIKALDKSARHDWRDMQRIKNELVGPEHDAVEIYPKESKLVDTSNQFHLWVFAQEINLPFGYQARLVGDGSYRGSRQRPFEVRPTDCLNEKEYERTLTEFGLKK